MLYKGSMKHSNQPQPDHFTMLLFTVLALGISY